jgi:DNA-binding MarR family transcriptional regulator
LVRVLHSLPPAHGNGKVLIRLDMEKSSDKANGNGIELGMLRSLLGYHLRRAQVAVFQHFTETMGEAAITPGQFGVLAVINGNPGLSQTQLGNALAIDRSTVVAVIDRLEARGLVIRAAQPNDRRSHALQLSDAGVALLRRLESMVREHERQIGRNLSSEDQRTLISLLDRVARSD